jgi:hypothetical protein
MTSPTAPGATRRWTNMTASPKGLQMLGFGLASITRFSTRVGTEMGYRIGEYVVKKVMQPVVTSSR